MEFWRKQLTFHLVRKINDMKRNYENEHDIRSRINKLTDWKRTWKNSGLTRNRTLAFAIDRTKPLRLFILLRRPCSVSYLSAVHIAIYFIYFLKRWVIESRSTNQPKAVTSVKNCLRDQNSLTKLLGLGSDRGHYFDKRHIKVHKFSNIIRKWEDKIV